MTNQTITWNRVTSTPPPEGVPVKTLSSSGVEQVLILKNGLWWHPDHSMYVYYTPEFWKS